MDKKQHLLTRLQSDSCVLFKDAPDVSASLSLDDMDRLILAARDARKAAYFIEAFEVSRD